MYPHSYYVLLWSFEAGKRALASAGWDGDRPRRQSTINPTDGQDMIVVTGQFAARPTPGTRIDRIGDILQSYTVGWTDWNIVLDLAGGPSWANKGIDAPILVDREGGEEWYKQPMYYILGHFSKYVPAGSVRLIPTMKRTNGMVEMVSFVTPDRKQVVVVLQNRDHRRSKSFRIQVSGTDKLVEGTLDRDSVSTLIIHL